MINLSTLHPALPLEVVWMGLMLTLPLIVGMSVDLNSTYKRDLQTWLAYTCLTLVPLSYWAFVAWRLF